MVEVSKAGKGADEVVGRAEVVEVELSVTNPGPG
jgi:hypothetical protein